jgi:hypothetical protein
MRALMGLVTMDTLFAFGAAASRIAAAWRQSIAVLWGVDMTARQFATELKVCGLRMAGGQIVSDDCPGIAWKPVTKRGQIDRASTLREVIRGRRAVIVRQVRIGMA